MKPFDLLDQKVNWFFDRIASFVLLPPRDHDHEDEDDDMSKNSSSRKSRTWDHDHDQEDQRMDLESNQEDLASSVSQLLDALFAFSLPRLQDHDHHDHHDHNHNGQEYEYESSYLECLSSVQQEIQPFGHVIPFHISRSLERSLDANKALLVSLQSMHQVQQAARRAIDPECIRLLHDIIILSSSREQEGEVCAAYCENVVSGCLVVKQSLLQVLWDRNRDNVRSLVRSMTRIRSSTTTGEEDSEKDHSSSSQYDAEHVLCHVLPDLLSQSIDHLIRNQSHVSLKVQCLVSSVV